MKDSYAPSRPLLAFVEVEKPVRALRNSRLVTAIADGAATLLSEKSRSSWRAVRCESSNSEDCKQQPRGGPGPNMAARCPLIHKGLRDRVRLLSPANLDQVLFEAAGDASANVSCPIP